MQNAIRYYKKEKFQALPKDKVIEVIWKINPNWSNDLWILKKWEEHFQKAGACYCICEMNTIYGKRLSLFKERYI